MRNHNLYLCKETGKTRNIITVMCLSIGTPKIIDFLFVPNGKLMIFWCPKI